MQIKKITLNQMVIRSMGVTKVRTAHDGIDRAYAGGPLVFKRRRGDLQPSRDKPGSAGVPEGADAGRPRPGGARRGCLMVAGHHAARHRFHAAGHAAMIEYDSVSRIRKEKQGNENAAEQDVRFR